MKAIGISRPTDSRCSEGEGSCDYYIPEVVCTLCKHRWSETEVWYPSLSISKNADRSKFAEDASVSPEELRSLQKQIVGERKRKLRLVPGAGIGPVMATIPRKATDFIWCGFRLLANRRAVELLQGHGVVIPHGPAVAKCNPRRSIPTSRLNSIPFHFGTTRL